MAIRHITIGSLANIHSYDDAVSPNAIETDGLIVGPIGSTTGADGVFNVLTSLQAGGGGAIGIQYKRLQLTVAAGIVSGIGPESAWIDV